jgi:hypothetical protein
VYQLSGLKILYILELSSRHDNQEASGGIDLPVPFSVESVRLESIESANRILQFRLASSSLAVESVSVTETGMSRFHRMGDKKIADEDSSHLQSAGDAST